METVMVSAPGKVILHGEHAVVFGKRAVAACLDIRTYTLIKKTKEDHLKLDLPDINISESWSTSEIKASLTLPHCSPLSPEPPSDELLNQMRTLAGITEDTADTRKLALVACLYLYSSILSTESNIPSLQLRVCSQLPPSAGLGSSAAYSTCLAAGLLLLGKHIPAPSGDENNGKGWTEANHIELINQWAFQAEKIIHGRPSGIDNSVSTYGGALCFQSGKITPLKKVPLLRILLTNTKIPRSTKILVAGVRERYNKYPEIMGPILDSIEAIAQKCEAVFSEMNSEPNDTHYSTLNDLIELNQTQLTAIGVSHQVLQQICEITAKNGLYSKLTGAGGGGCAFTLIKPGTPQGTVDEIKGLLTSSGFECWETSIGGAGVQYHANYPTDMTLNLMD